MPNFTCTTCGFTKELYIHLLTPSDVNRCPECGELSYILKENEDD